MVHELKKTIILLWIHLFKRDNTKIKENVHAISISMTMLWEFLVDKNEIQFDKSYPELKVTKPTQCTNNKNDLNNKKEKY